MWCSSVELEGIGRPYGVVAHQIVVTLASPKMSSSPEEVYHMDEAWDNKQVGILSAALAESRARGVRLQLNKTSSSAGRTFYELQARQLAEAVRQLAEATQEIGQLKGEISRYRHQEKDLANDLTSGVSHSPSFFC